MGVDVGVIVGVDVFVGVGTVGVFVGVDVGTMGVLVKVGVDVLVIVGVLVEVKVGVNVLVPVVVGVKVAGRKGVSEAVAVLVIVPVGETVLVRMLGVRLPVAVRMLKVPVSEGMTKSVLVGVTVGALGSGASRMAIRPRQ